LDQINESISVMKNLLGIVVILSALAAGTWNAPAQTSAQAKVQLPGPRPDGSVLLPNQWSLRPAGRQVTLGDFPANIAVHPGGRFAAVLHSGYGQHEIAVVDLQGATVVTRQKIHEGFYGLEFSRDGKKLYASGSSDEDIHVFDFADGKLTEKVPLKLRDAQERGIPCGLAVSADGKWLYAANVWGQSVSKVSLADGSLAPDMLPSATGTGDSTRKVEAAKTPDMDEAAANKRAEAVRDPLSAEAPFPYACRLDDRRQLLYVSLWAQACVAVIDVKSDKLLAHWATQEHPNEMALTKSGRLLFVANANRNTVTVLDTKTGKTVETLCAAFSPKMPPGSTPSSVALSPDEKTLFVANANNNNVAVFDVSAAGKSRSLGFIPVGWYPTSVRVTPDGKHLLVANGKGLTSMANPNGPVPGERRNRETQYIGGLFPGSLSIIDLESGAAFPKQLAAWTQEAYLCTPRDNASATVTPANNPIPSAPGQASPIKYCIYIIKENRTYDQVLGDMPEGNGDAALCLFPEKVTPNHHKIARDFVLLDNFYVDAEVSANGHEWSMGAYASDFVEKTWRLNYGHGRSRKFPYPAEGTFYVAGPADGYIWDRARAAGVSYRSYGEFVHNGPTTNDPVFTRTDSLKDHYDPMYRSFDLDYPDVERAARFMSDLKEFEAADDMPRLQIVRLPNDHTEGAAAGKPTPTAFLADNDVSLGMVVEAVSRSKFWAQTAIFVLEDDAQDGPDHVDAHRSIAFIASPYARRGAVDSTMYSTSSMLRTMELILGLEPMSQFDAAAMPMYNSFQATPDLRPYEARQTMANVNERNTATAWGSAAARKMDFSKEDATDEQLLNEMVWRSVKGADQPMPAPMRAAFVMAQPKDRDDD
jgi:DNA-binding beta-propeller fold protein YncE